MSDRCASSLPGIKLFVLKRKSGRFEEDLRETLWRVSVPHTGMPLRVCGSGEAVWAFLHSSVRWDVTVRRDVFLPTVRPDSDGSKRAARRRTCPPLAWMECTYQNLVPVTAVATETASRACVSVTWDTRVRPTCVSGTLLVKAHSHTDNTFWVYYFLCLRILELGYPSTWTAEYSAVSSHLERKPAKSTP